MFTPHLSIIGTLLYLSSLYYTQYASLKCQNMVLHDSYLITILHLDLFKQMEKDIIDGVIRYGPKMFSSILFEYNIISSSNLKLISLLSKYISPRNVSVMLVEILANNIKDQTVFKDFIVFLGNVPSLRYIYIKINIVFG